MLREQVVVTGLGIVSPLAADAPEHMRRWLAGASGVKRSEQPAYRDIPAALEARVVEMDRRERVPNRMLRKLLSQHASDALIAAGEALRDAGLSGEEQLQRCGLYVGSISADTGPDVFTEAFGESMDQNGVFDLERFAKRGMKLLDPLFLVKGLPNAGVCGISVQHQVLGPNVNLTNGAISGLQAIAMAAATIRRGEMDFALAGGYDSLLRMDHFADHLISERLSKRREDPTRACRPFDKTRDGYALGEGAVFVLLESATHARARGARAYAEILGAGHTSNAPLLHQVRKGNPLGTALAQAARQALGQAGCDAGDLDVLFIDGLGTYDDDLREAAAIRLLLGDAQVPCTAATSAVGFTGAASGTFSLAHAVATLRDQVVPPLFNCTQPDPQCNITFVEQPEQRPWQRGLIWNSDRRMKNVALVIGTSELSA